MLTTLGLAAALAAEAAHSAISVRVSAEEVGVSEPEVELAVYLCCLELMQNAAKHAGSGATVAVELGLDGDKLVFSVRDDGCGFDHRATPWGAGLTGIRDRIRSVGGRLEVVAETGAGTTATGVVPWPFRAA